LAPDVVRCHHVAIKEEYSHAGLPPPDKDMAQAKYLQEAIEVPDLALLKDHIKFYIATSRLQISSPQSNRSVPWQSGYLPASPVLSVQRQMRKKKVKTDLVSDETKFKEFVLLAIGKLFKDS
jgi:hypothetical protein